MRDQIGEESNSLSRTTESVALENQLLRLFSSAFFDQTTELMRVIDQALEEVSTESDPRFDDLRRLRSMYATFNDEPDEAQLATLQEELSRAASAGKQ